MSNGPKIVDPKPAKAATRLDELVSQLTNKHAQQRAATEWQALIEIAKMDGATVQEAFSMVRDIIALRQVLALEAIAGELHGINQGVMNFVLMTEMAANPDAPAEGEGEGEGEDEATETTPDTPATAEENAAAVRGAQVEP